MALKNQPKRGNCIIANFWIIRYKERTHEDDTPQDEPHKFSEWQTCAIDVDSVVTIENSTHENHRLPLHHWLEVDNGWTYHAQILEKVTEDEVIAEMDFRSNPKL